MLGPCLKAGVKVQLFHALRAMCYLRVPPRVLPCRIPLNPERRNEKASPPQDALRAIRSPSG